MYKEVLEKHGVKQTPELTQKILTYEVGKLWQIDVYVERLGSAGYIGDRRRELQDVLTMISLLIEQEGYGLEEERQVGLETFDYRISEVRKAELERRRIDEKQ